MSDKTPPSSETPLHSSESVDVQSSNGHTPLSPSPGPPAWASLPDLSDETALPPPAGRYHAKLFHKRGGMGQVWRARDTELAREVAFKVIRPRYADDETTRRRFVFEAEVTGRLEHPAVIPVYGFGRDADGRPYYAMRFVEGQSLHEAIAAFHGPDAPTGVERSLTLRRLLGHFVTVCRAIDYAHNRGIIHRDLKPANVMVGAYGETLVVDWGIAKRLRIEEGEPESAPTLVNEPDTPTPDPNRSLRGTRLGSPGYWSPEQAAGRPDLHDERTDVYGLGAILFAILTSMPPHPDGVHSAEPPGPRARCPWVDAGIDAIARKAMAYEPTERYQTATEVAQAVEVWLADQPVLAQREAVEALAQEATKQPHDFALAEQLARQRSNLGLMLAGMSRDADALSEFRAAVDIFARLAEARKKPRFLADQANCLLALARSHAALDQETDAKTAQRDAANLYKQLIATRPDEYKANYATLMLPPGAMPDLAEESSEPFPTMAPFTAPPLASAKAEQATAPQPESTADRTWHSAPSIPDPRKTTPPINPDSFLSPMDTRAAPPGPGAPAERSSDEHEQPLHLSGGYTLLGQLAQGGMGVVYLARDNVLRRRVVIKALHEHAANQPDIQARFVSEVRITASLQHPNIARVYTCGTRNDGMPFMVMEYLNGASLLVMLNAQGPGWTSTLLDPLAQACDGLHYAHTRGVVHRDAKLANIVVAPTGRAVVLDWGIAKVLDGYEGADEESDGGADREGFDDAMLTHTGTVMGTPAYMSPEQARGETNNISPQSDIFTLGADLFHLVSGQPPGHGGAVFEMLERLLHGDIPRLRDARPDAPPQLDAICARAMAFRPEDRYPTAAALAADIRAFLASSNKPTIPVIKPAVKPATKDPNACPSCGRVIPGRAGTRYCIVCDQTC